MTVKPERSKFTIEDHEPGALVLLSTGEVAVRTAGLFDKYQGPVEGVKMDGKFVYEGMQVIRKLLAGERLIVETRQAFED